MSFRLPGIGLLALCLVSCGDDAVSDGTGGVGGGTATTELPCEIKEFLADKCASCHGAEPKFGAPMPLQTREDLLAMTIDGQDSVAARVVVRLASDTARMPPPPQSAATEEEIALIQEWIDAGHPEADDTCDSTGGSGGMGGSPVGCTPDIQLAGKSPFEMPSNSVDEQVCFGITLPAGADKRHITAIVPRIDNDKIIHHILLMQSPTEVPSEPNSCSFTSLDWKLIYAWGPGTPPQVMPDEAGFPIDPDEETHFVLQVHYNNLKGLVGETDQSGIDLCTTDELRDHDADVMAFGGIQFDGIAPNATSKLSCELTIPGELAGFLPLNIVQSWPHMHQLGRGHQSWIEHEGGETTQLTDLDDYDFDYQNTYPSPAEVNVGDTVHTNCTWQNTTSSTVGFGEDTADEMCFNFVTYYPRIEAAQWNWLLPSYISTCDMATP